MSPRSELLIKTPKRGNVTNILKQKRINILPHEKTMNGKHASVVFGNYSPMQKKFAIKKQVIRSPRNINDRSYRELKILEQLSTLKGSKYYPCDTNFVDFVDWFKVSEGPHYMNYVLGCEDFTLESYVGEKALDLYEYKCILFQILFGIYVAQKEFEFVHNDLHLKNVLLRKPVENVCYLYTAGKFKWYTTGYLVKITDFGLSRMDLGKGQITFEPKSVDKDVFNYMLDTEKIFQEFKKIKINDDSWVSKKEIESEKINDPESDESSIAEKLKKSKKASLNRLRRLIKLTQKPEKMLTHPFFAELQTQPDLPIAEPVEKNSYPILNFDFVKGEENNENSKDDDS